MVLCMSGKRVHMFDSRPVPLTCRRRACWCRPRPLPSLDTQSTLALRRRESSEPKVKKYM